MCSSASVCDCQSCSIASIYHVCDRLSIIIFDRESNVPQQTLFTSRLGLSWMGLIISPDKSWPSLARAVKTRQSLGRTTCMMTGGFVPAGGSHRLGDRESHPATGTNVVAFCTVLCPIILCVLWRQPSPHRAAHWKSNVRSGFILK